MKIAFFDYDGTIRDSSRTLFHIYRELFIKHDLGTITYDDFFQTGGLSAVEIIRALSPNIDNKVLTQVTEDISIVEADIYKQNANAGGVPMFDGIEDALKTLKSQGWTLGIATGASKQGLMDGLESYKITDLFEFYHNATEFPSKPNPEMIVDALRTYECKFANAVMVGDTMFDIKLAENAGIASIGVTWGGSTKEKLLELGATKTVDDSMELVNVINSLVK